MERRDGLDTAHERVRTGQAMMITRARFTANRAAGYILSADCTAVPTDALDQSAGVPTRVAQ